MCWSLILEALLGVKHSLPVAFGTAWGTSRPLIILSKLAAADEAQRLRGIRMLRAFLAVGVEMRFCGGRQWYF
jgi:hypothetical protein